MLCYLASLGMTLHLKPIHVDFSGKITLQVDLGFTTLSKVLYQQMLYSYTAPTIDKKLVDNHNTQTDTTPPQVTPYAVSGYQ